MENLLPCPFCGDVPTLPNDKGTQYEMYCDCGMAMSTVQISDLMTIDEREHGWLGYMYGQFFFIMVRAVRRGGNNERLFPGATVLCAPESRAIVLSSRGAWARRTAFLPTPVPALPSSSRNFIMDAPPRSRAGSRTGRIRPVAPLRRRVPCGAGRGWNRRRAIAR